MLGLRYQLQISGVLGAVEVFAAVIALGELDVIDAPSKECVQPTVENERQAAHANLFPGPVLQDAPADDGGDLGGGAVPAVVGIALSGKEVGVLFNAKIKACGLFYDKVLKKYTSAPPEEEKKGARGKASAKGAKGAE